MQMWNSQQILKLMMENRIYTKLCKLRLPVHEILIM